MKTKIKLSPGERVFRLLTYILLAVFSFCCIYPFILTLVVSFTAENAVLREGYNLFPSELSTLAYETVFKDGSILNGYIVSISMTVIGTISSLIICGMAGYAMSLSRVKYRNKISMYFYIPMVFSAGLLPWYLVCTQLLHLQNTYWALIVPALVSPFNVFLMRNYFKTLPESLIESAEIDGCGVMRTFFKIVMPLSTPIIATSSLFIGLGYWNDWTNALWFISDQKLYPLQYLLYRIQSIITFIKQNGSTAGMEMPAQTFQFATLFVTIGPIILLYPFVQRYFVKGIMIGAVKG